MLLTMFKTKQIKIKHNEKEWPKDYRCSFLEQGLVSYEDVGAGVALLRKETIDKMLQSIIGKPVLIDHKDVTPEDFKKNAVGYVTGAEFNPADGWFYCTFILTDDKAKQKVEQGYSVSCSFDVKETVKGGEWHAIKYDEEITEAEFTHLALVTTPRYEDCRIYVNSKKAEIKPPKKLSVKEIKLEIQKAREANDQGAIKMWLDELERVEKGNNKVSLTNKEGGNMFKLFRKKNAAAEADTKDPQKQKFNASDVFVDIDGQKIPLSELFQHITDNIEEELQEILMGDEVEGADGKQYKISDMVANYKAKKNVAEEEKKKAEEAAAAEAKAKENAEKKCSCNAKENDAHAEGCPLHVKKNDGETEEEKKIREEKEKKEKEDKETEAKENAKKEADAKLKKDNAHFVKLNALKEAGEEVTGLAVDTLGNKIERGSSKYGSEKK